MAYSPHTLFLLFLLIFFSDAYQGCPGLVNYTCPDFHGTSLRFPFTTSSLPDCGYCVLECQKRTATSIQCGKQQLAYQIKEIFPKNNTLVLVYPGLHELTSHACKLHQNDSVIIPSPPLTGFRILQLMVFIRCLKHSDDFPPNGPSTTCENGIIYGPHAVGKISDGEHPPDCSTIYLPNSTNDYFPIQYQLPVECLQCTSDGSRCFDPSTYKFHCPRKGNHKLAIILGTVLPGCLVIILALLILYRRQRNIKPDSSALISRRRSDLEDGSMEGVAVFSYNELQEATNNFDPTRELGEGGFGIVYYGKLSDGTEVAVKRLFEKNYKRVEQFKNEIRILTVLRHKNLVTLYGCTSRHSRELLLVYEYIPNGTVADHLHGDNAKSESITWSTRMNIAIETAEALSYLHFNDIIHRDVKTNNILLDKNFCVKVADFGLSRLFPADVTHISTAPQGTPGYLDPEYYQCYHLTDKSDVYSFGVVLIELISSLPAVDIERHRHEINLSNYAMNRIQGCAFKELVDPNLGFETDFKVRRMTTLVGELAFQCLQHERELRPSMYKVLQALKRIANADYDALESEEMSTGTTKVMEPTPSPTSSNDVILVKNAQEPPLSSPDSVIDKGLSMCVKPLPSPTDNDEFGPLRNSQPPSADSATSEWLSMSKKRSPSPTADDDVVLLRNVEQLPSSPNSVMDKWLSKCSTPNTSS